MRKGSTILIATALVAAAFTAPSAAVTTTREIAAPRIGTPVGFAADAIVGNHWTGEKGYIPLTDGTQLAYQVLLPHADEWGSGPFPLVIDYSGYRPADEFWDGVHRTFLAQGYAVAGVNIRGSGCSSGSFDFFDRTVGTDGYEMIEWLADRPWSNGDVGLVGKSYPGISQLFVAATRPPSLRAIVPGHYIGDVYRDVAYPGGIENVVFAGAWALYAQPAPSAQQAAAGLTRTDQACIAAQAGRPRSVAQHPFIHATAHHFDDDWWHERGAYWLPSFFGPERSITAPTMSVISWQDEQVGSRGLHITETVLASAPRKTVVTNGDHGEYYGATVLAEIFRFLNFHLRGAIPASDPQNSTGSTLSRASDPTAFAAATAAYMAEPSLTVLWETQRTAASSGARNPASVTRHATWPVPGRKETRFHLRSGGGLTSQSAGSGEAATHYLYTPAWGSQGQGMSLADGIGGGFGRVPPAGSVAAFTSSALAEPLTMLGGGSVNLFLTSTAPDTDVEVMLTEVRPDGQEMYVQKGVLRASRAALDIGRSTWARPFHRHDPTTLTPLIPTRIGHLAIELFPTGHVFRAGSKLRLWVQSPGVVSELWGLAAYPTPAVNSIHHTNELTSSLIIETLPGFTPATGLAPCGLVRNQPCRPNPLS